MFRALFRQAQASVEASVTHVLERVIVAIPFLLAAGFGTAALTLYLMKSYGAEMATLIMAAIFALVGLVVMGAVNASTSREGDAAEGASSTGGSSDAPPGSGTQQGSGPFAEADRDMLMAGLTALGPVALPHILRLAVRHLPIIAAVAAAAYVVSRQSMGGEGSEASRTADPS